MRRRIINNKFWIEQKECIILKITLGYVPTRRDVFSREEALRYRSLVREKISDWGADIIDIDDINNEGLLFDERDLPAVLKKMKDKKVTDCSSHTAISEQRTSRRSWQKPSVSRYFWGAQDDAPLEDGLHQEIHGADFSPQARC